MTLHQLRTAAALAAIGIAPSCATAGVQAPVMHPPFLDAAPDSTKVAPVVVADTEEDLWPDPVERTQVRLESLHNVIESYRADCGRLPPTLEELIATEPGFGWFIRDAWGQVIQYRASGDEFVLASAGADRKFGTDDDLVAMRGYVRPIHPRPSGHMTRARIRAYRRAITLYTIRSGAIPTALDDLIAAGLSPRLGIQDEWGGEIVYTSAGPEVELRSAGPDRVLKTDDDIIVQGLDEVLLRVAPELRRAQDR